MMRQYFSTWQWQVFLERCRNSRNLVLFVVFVALFLDNMLLTVVGKSGHGDVILCFFLDNMLLIVVGKSASC